MIYPLLKKLENEKLIEKKVIIQEGKPNKNMYKITNEGRAHFEQYLKSELEKDIFKSDFLMRMYFAEYMENDQLLKLIEQEVNNKKDKVKQLEKQRSKWEQEWSKNQKLTYDIGIEQYKSNVKILEEFLDESDF